MDMISPLESRILDKNSECLGVPVSVLMDNAGRELAKVVDTFATGRILFICGSGNNGGDGYAASLSLNLFFALRINGDSMEPLYHNGDMVLVQNCSSVEVGELGIFVLDGDGYFKKYGGDRIGRQQGRCRIERT